MRCIVPFVLFGCLLPYKMVKKHRRVAGEVVSVLLHTTNDNMNSCKLSRGHFGKTEDKDLRMYITFELVIPQPKIDPEERIEEVPKVALYTQKYSTCF